MKKIVVIGPESTGKSTLCTQLAAHYNTLWVAEYAREYLLKNGTDYNFEQLMEIADGQLRSEEETAARLQKEANNRLLIIDTDMYVMKVWSEIVFNKCDNRILNRIVEQKYDLYLLCNTDLPWVQDALREYPDLATRRKIYQFYLDAMANQPVPWVQISGSYEERFAKAVTAIDKLFI
ncbi:MAG: ATP-binding protein [Ferruginibacter sp.]